jgi:predicted phosphodiesterase
LQKEILEYCLSRKGKGSDLPTWNDLAKEIFEVFNFQVNSVSGLRSRVAEYRRDRDSLARYVPGHGLIIPKSEGWGDGRAQLVEKATSRAWEIVVFISDIHAPHHNAAQFMAFIDLIHDIQPDVIVINGDTNDFFQLSRFNKSHEREDSLQEELDIGVDLRRAIRLACPNAVIRETLGNHCERILTYVQINAKALSSLRALSPEYLFGLKDLEIEHYGREGFLLRPEFVVEHGHVTRKDAGASAKTRLNDTMISGIMGHCHRLAGFHRSGYRKLSWYEQGCMCLPEADYVVGETNWQPGFAVGHFHTTKDDLFNVELVGAVNDGFIFGGKIYGNVESGVLSNA